MSQAPPLALRQQPGLSETLTGPSHPARCRSCGAGNLPGAELQRWRECDPWDRPTYVVVVLCARCADRLIEPHPRMYHRLEANQPWPGCMSLCQLCRQREGTSCRHPDAKANGGAGLTITIAEPVRMHVCRSPRRLSGFVTLWPTRATECSGRATLALHTGDAAP